MVPPCSRCFGSKLRSPGELVDQAVGLLEGVDQLVPEAFDPNGGLDAGVPPGAVLGRLGQLANPTCLALGRQSLAADRGQAPERFAPVIDGGQQSGAAQLFEPRPELLVGLGDRIEAEVVGEHRREDRLFGLVQRRPLGGGEDQGVLDRGVGTELAGGDPWRGAHRRTFPSFF
jgi:hypothetical protein